MFHVQGSDNCLVGLFISFILLFVRKYRTEVLRLDVCIIV